MTRGFRLEVSMLMCQQPMADCPIAAVTFDLSYLSDLVSLNHSRCYSYGFLFLLWSYLYY